MALELLAMGRSIGSIARLLEVDPRTIYRWRQDESFQGQLSRRRNELWSDLGARLRALAAPSLNELEQQLFGRYDRARFRAATAILRFVNVKKCIEEGRESEDL